MSSAGSLIIEAMLTAKTLLKFQHDIRLWCRVGNADGGANGGVEGARLPSPLHRTTPAVVYRSFGWRSGIRKSWQSRL
jgi:hypothetical protein